MSGLDTIYAQTVTVFTRIPAKYGNPTMWVPTVIEGVHLIVSKSSTWSSNGGKNADNAKLHVRYKHESGECVITCAPDLGGYGDTEKVWHEPKAWRRAPDGEKEITFSHGENDDFDFFVEGAITEFTEPIIDDNFERVGFYGYMNSMYDNVFVITGVQKFNLIPHFEITAR